MLPTLFGNWLVVPVDYGAVSKWDRLYIREESFGGVNIPLPAATPGRECPFQCFNLDERPLLLQRHGLASREGADYGRGGRLSYLVLFERRTGAAGAGEG